jgi:chromosome partitioning protein
VTQIIAVFNQAGGVAKTTLVHNLSYHLSQRHHRVLAIDMDPQASLTTFMDFLPEDLSTTVYDALVNQAPLPIQEDIHGVDLAPANIRLSTAEKQLVAELAREGRLAAAIDPIRDEYDFIWIDCPPSLGLLSVLSLTAATAVLVPIETQFKAFEGTNLLLDTVRQIRRASNPELHIAGFVPTRYDARNTQDVRTLGAIQAELTAIGPIFPAVPRSTAFADAAEQRQPLAKYARRHPAIAVLEDIAAGLEALSDAR